MHESQKHNWWLIRTVTKTCVLSLVALVGMLIAMTCVNYFPPTFETRFLQGRESYFYSWYAVAFYTHITSATTALFVGLLQSIRWLRVQRIQLHRRLGMVYVYVVLLFAAPSGLAMAFKANGSIIAVAGFAILAIATAWTTWLGLHHIRHSRVAEHRRWMTRSYLLMCSAVTLRFLAEFTNEFQLGISYDAMAWLSWVPQVAAYEIFQVLTANRHNPSPKANG